MNALNNLKLHLKNKEKGCDYCFDTLCGGKEIRCGSKYKKNYETSGWDKSKDILYCPICQAEIAILEQAIAEIENIQSQQNGKGDDALRQQTTSELSEGTKASIPSYKGATCKPETQSADISNLLQKQRQEILEKIRLEFHTFREEFIESELNIEDFDIGNLLYNIEQQLNQPKTEE